jgi:hypothetical protein
MVTLKIGNKNYTVCTGAPQVLKSLSKKLPKQ